MVPEERPGPPRHDANPALGQRHGMRRTRRPISHAPAPDGNHLIPAAGTRSPALALLAATRPRQWIKNLLVFAAPAAAGVLGTPSVIARTTEAVGIFVLASAGTYLINDAIDAPTDRAHPDKRCRPVAAGELSVAFALRVGSGALLVAMLAAALLSGARLFEVLGAYIAISVSYTLWLKRVPVLELACVSAGFVLRAMAGGAAIHVPISPWFALVTSSAAMFIVAGKRSAELSALGTNAASHRDVLRVYRASYLRTLRTIAAAVAVFSYGVWAFAQAIHLVAGVRDADHLLLQLSIIPFVLGIFTLELAFENGEGGAPEDLLRNHALQALGAIGTGLLVAGIYS